MVQNKNTIYQRRCQSKLRFPVSCSPFPVRGTHRREILFDSAQQVYPGFESSRTAKRGTENVNEEPLGLHFSLSVSMICVFDILAEADSGVIEGS